MNHPPNDRPSTVLSILALLTLLLIPAAPAAAQCPATVWADEFDGTVLDALKWEPMIGTGTDYGLPSGWGNNELQYYQADNATVSDGTLKIEAREENVGGNQYTSARIRTKNLGDWTFGRFEAEIKMTVGQGLWPAFWMLSTDEVFGGWPQSGEIDIMENIGSEPSTVLGTIHYGDLWPNNQSQGASYSLPNGERFTDGFYTFAVEKEAGVIRWLVDDVLYSTKTPADLGPYNWPFDEDFHFLLNVAVGGNLPGNPDGTTVFPQTLEVEYVRVYDGNFPHLAGDSRVDNMESGVAYSVGNAFSGSSFAWTVPAGATIASGQGTSSITVDWGATGGDVTVDITSGCGNEQIAMPVTVDPAYNYDLTLENFDDPANITFQSSTGTLVEIANPDPSGVNTSAFSGEYTRDAGEQFDILVYDVSMIDNASQYSAELKRFYMDVYTAAPVGTGILIQLEDSALASPTNYPTGRHSRYQAFTSVQNQWQRLAFTFLDTPDPGTPDGGVDDIVILFASNSFTGDVFTFDNFDSYAVDPVCGNGVVETGEACDGADFGGATCGSEGFYCGDLACNVNCTLDTSSCLGGSCGDGIIQCSEECDGANLGGETCESQGFDSGTLACDGGCGFDTDACVDDPGPGGTIVFDDMEHGDPFNNGWFIFFGGGGGGLDPNTTDLPPEDGGLYSLQTGWGSGGVPGFFGGFGRTNPTDLSGATHFNFWINPNAGQDYLIEINLQDDDNGDGAISSPADDEFQFNCVVSPSGPCAVAGGGWQLVSIPLADFFDDNSFLFGGNGVLDAVPTSAGGNGQLINVVLALISNSGADIEFRTDYWAFGGPPELSVWDDFEDGDSSDWFFFGGNSAGGGGGVLADRPQEGDFYLSTGWGGNGSASVFYGGAFKNVAEADQQVTPLDPWFNVWVLNQSDATVDQYTLEITIREDTDGNGWIDGQEDSFRLDTVFPASSFDDEWTLVSAPISAFMNVANGGNDTFDGKLDEVVVVISGVQGGAGSTVEVDFDYFALTAGGPLVEPTEVVFDDMEHGNPFNNGWFTFGGSVGGGGIDPNFGDLPPILGGSASLQTGWGSGGVPGFFGGFGRTNPVDLFSTTHFNLWINPDAIDGVGTDQDYLLEINLQDDDDGDGAIPFPSPADDEFQYNCVVSPTGTCAVSGGGWQLVSIPLADFFDDNSIHGGNGVLDAVSTARGGNGELISIVIAVIGNTGSDATFRTDYWSFTTGSLDGDGDRVPDALDNCPADANADQADNDGDGQGDVCDGDDDNDGVADGGDNCPFDANPGQADYEADGQGDVCDDDDDNDGVADGDDDCAFSDLGATVVIDGCDSGVDNTLLGGGCNIGDEIAEIAAGATNHGNFVSGVARLTNRLKRAGILTGAQKGAVMSCAAGADIP